MEAPKNVIGCDATKEVWKDIEIPDMPYRYIISNFGRIIALEKYVYYQSGFSKKYKERDITPKTDRSGYLFCHFKCISKNVDVCKSIHQLVATAFIPNPENKPMVNHKDGNKINNNVLNLEWATAYENNKHAIETGLSIRPVGGVHYKAKLNFDKAREIRRMYSLRLRTVKNLSSEYNVNHRTITRIIYNEIWKENE